MQLVKPLRIVALIGMLTLVGAAEIYSSEYVSYPPLRPLPTPSQRALATGPAYFVDSVRGEDAGPGSIERPWKTVVHALAQLKAGDTLYLRGGIYWERIIAGPQGTAKAPITVRSYPGESAILDGGYREFWETFGEAWQPCSEGVAGEYRSNKSYPDFQVGGNFGDSLVPL